MRKQDLLRLLHDTISLSKSGLKLYQEEGSAYDNYMKGLLEGQRKFAQSLADKLELEEIVVENEPDVDPDINLQHADFEWCGDFRFFIYEDDGTKTFGDAVEGKFRYDGYYLYQWENNEWISWAYLDGGGGWYLDDDNIKQEGAYDGFVIRERYLGDDCVG